MEVLGERWTFLIVREAFFGVRRFTELQRNLGIARNILSARLQTLTRAGILETIRLGPSAGLVKTMSGELQFDRFVSTRGSSIGP